METLFWLLPISLTLFVVAMVAFVWAVNNGQFDQLDSRGLEVLDEEDEMRNEQ